MRVLPSGTLERQEGDEDLVTSGVRFGYVPFLSTPPSSQTANSSCAAAHSTQAVAAATPRALEVSAHSQAGGEVASPGNIRLYGSHALLVSS